MWRLQLVPVWYEFGAQPHPPHSMQGPTWSRARWSWAIMISHVGDGYGLAAGKPMLVGLLTRPAPDRKSGLTAMIDRISRGRGGVVRALRQTQDME